MSKDLLLGFIEFSETDPGIEPIAHFFCPVCGSISFCKCYPSHAMYGIWAPSQLPY